MFRSLCLAVSVSTVLAISQSPVFAQGGSTGAERSPAGTVQRPNTVRPDADPNAGSPGPGANGVSSGETGAPSTGDTLVTFTTESCRRGWTPAMNISREEFLQACQNR